MSPLPFRANDRLRELVDRLTRALEVAAPRIRGFHERQLPAPLEYTSADGTYDALKHPALQSAGAYVPAGTAVLPSSVLMNVIPAKVAVVERIAAITRLVREGFLAPATLFACALCGVDELYACGGAQGIAAAAYGTLSVARVDKSFARETFG